MSIFLTPVKKYRTISRKPNNTCPPPPPRKSKLQWKHNKPFCAWMVLYFARLNRGIDTLSTLTSLGGGVDKCCRASVRWFFISHTPEPNHISKPRKKNKTRQATDCFGHYFRFSWGMCEAIPGAPPTNQNNNTGWMTLKGFF